MERYRAVLGGLNFAHSIKVKLIHGRDLYDGALITIDSRIKQKIEDKGLENMVVYNDRREMEDVEVEIRGKM